MSKITIETLRCGHDVQLSVNWDGAIFCKTCGRFTDSTTALAQRKAEAITPETRFVACVLVTDTMVYEIVGRTAKTLKLRRTADGERSIRDTKVDGGTDPNCPPVIWTEQVPAPDAKTITVRLRKDGTYRTYSWSALRPCTEIDGMPVRRTDYRF